MRLIDWPHDAVVFDSAASSELAAPAGLMAVSASEGSPTPIKVGAEATYVGQAAWSADGERLALIVGNARHVHAYAGNGDLYVMDAAGTALEQLTHGARVSSPSWSPDGRHIALVRNQGQQLVTIDVANADVTVIARRLGYYQLPAWSPDGRWIAFQSSPDAASERVTEAVYVIRPNGTGLRRLTDATASEGFPAWSPDASHIVFSAGERLWMMDADGSDPVQVTTHCRLPCVADFAPAWSPDGRRIAFLRQEDGGGAIRLYVLDLRSGRISPLTPDERWVSFPRWRP